MVKIRLSFLLFLLFLFPVGIAPAAQGDDSGFILPQYSQKISLDFKNADLKDVLKVFSKQIGANFITEKDVTDQKVSVFLDNVPVEEALTRVLSANGLAYDYDESMNLFVVKVAPEDEKKVITRIFPLRYASVDSSKMKTAGGGTAGGSFSGGLSVVLSPKGKVVDDTRTNSIIVMDVEENFPEIERMIARLDIPVKQVVIEVEMLDVSKTTADKVGAKFNLTAAIGAGKKTTYLPFDDDVVKDKYSGTTTYTAGKIDFTGSTLALDFIKSQSDTKSLARPRIITANNETATIQISTNEAIGLVNSQSTDTATSTKQAERVQTGVFLTVTPQVNDLTDEISMVVEPKVIDATSRVTFDGTSFANPEERSVKVTLRVANGNTVVIGGLLRRSTNDARTSLPLISKIPFLGMPFRHKDTNTSERELMVFLTPYVLDSDKPMPVDLKKSMEKQRQIREQSVADKRSGSIDKEMDEVNRFRKGL